MKFLWRKLNLSCSMKRWFINFPPSLLNLVGGKEICFSVSKLMGI